MKELLSARVLKNTGALMVFQVSNYLIPLLIIPYLVRVLGIDTFGQWMFALSFVIFARVCVAYGFDLTAAREVAFAAGDERKISRLLTDVVMCRLLIWLACFIVLAIVCLCVPKVQAVGGLIFVGMGIVLGEALIPVWLFLGTERMGSITSLRLGSKLLNMVLILLCVHGPGDVLLVPLFEAAISVILGCISVGLAMRYFNLRFVPLSLGRIITQARSGSAVFLSTVAVQLYTTAHTVVLGLVVGPAAVSAYALAEKIYSAIRGLLNPVIQSVFPVMARVHNASASDFSRLYRHATLTLVPVLFLVGLLLYLCAPLFVSLLTGGEDPATLQCLRIFAMAFPFAVGGFLSPMLVVRGGDSHLMWISVGSGIIGLSLAIPLAKMYQAPGAAIAFLVVQIFGAVALVLVNMRMSQQPASNNSR